MRKIISKYQTTTQPKSVGIKSYGKFFFSTLRRSKSCMHTHSPSRLLWTRDFKQYPADPSGRLLVLPSGMLSLFALCLPCPAAHRSHARKHVMCLRLWSHLVRTILPYNTVSRSMLIDIYYIYIDGTHYFWDNWQNESAPILRISS